MQEADWKRMNDRVNAANKFNQVQNDPTLFQISEFIEHLRDQFAQHHIDRDPVDMLIRALRQNAFADADGKPEFYYLGHDLIPVDPEYLKAALSADLCDAETFFKYSFAKRAVLARWCRHPAQNIELPMGWELEKAPTAEQTENLEDHGARRSINGDKAMKKPLAARALIENRIAPVNNSSSSFVPARRKRGPVPVKQEAIKKEMQKMPPNDLIAMKEEEMAAKFGACRTTCRDARDIVLSILPTNSDQ